MYPADPVLWRTDMGPAGRFREWIVKDKKAPVPKWMSPEVLLFALPYNYECEVHEISDCRTLSTQRLFSRMDCTARSITIELY